MRITYPQFANALISLSAVAATSRAATLSFEDQAGAFDSSPAISLDSYYLSTDGVNVKDSYSAGGVTVTFSGFGRVLEGYSDENYVPGTTNPDEHKSIYGDADDPTITFSSAVTISSFWVYTQSSNYYFGPNFKNLMGFGAFVSPGDADPVFSYQAPEEVPGDFWQISAATGKLLDDVPIRQLRFTNFGGVLFDELTFYPAITTFDITPEPASMLAVAGLGAIGLRRRPVRHEK